VLQSHPSSVGRRCLEGLNRLLMLQSQADIVQAFEQTSPLKIPISNVAEKPKRQIRSGIEVGLQFVTIDCLRSTGQVRHVASLNTTVSNPFSNNCWQNVGKKGR
jgi:hypothetical protein